MGPPDRLYIHEAALGLRPANPQRKTVQVQQLDGDGGEPGEHRLMALTPTARTPHIRPLNRENAVLLGTEVGAGHPEPALAVGLADLGRYLVRQRRPAENADAPPAH